MLVPIGQLGDAVAYYSHLRDSVVLGQVFEDVCTEGRFVAAPDAETISDHVAAFVEVAHESEQEFRLTRFGKALSLAGHLADRRVIERRQSQVFARRDVFEVSRRDTAAILLVAPSTVDSTLRNTTERVTGIRESAALLADVGGGR